MKEKLIKRIANNLSEQMTEEMDLPEWSEYTKNTIGFLEGCGIHLSKWRKENGKIVILLDDLNTDDCAWSD